MKNKPKSRLDATRRSARSTRFANQGNEVIDLNTFREPERPSKFTKRVDIYPRNDAQEQYLDQLMDENNRIVIASGSAGTGKSYMATLAAIKFLREGSTSKIIITRPMVEVENEQVGFLPGDLNEKLAPWVRPLMDIFEEHYTKYAIAKMLADGVIEVSPLSFMRGRSFRNAIIIADEMQNATPNQMLMLLTRISTNSRILLTGDTRQTDRYGDQNGLVNLLTRLQNSERDGIVYTLFDKRHVERDPIVSEVLDLYEEC